MELNKNWKYFTLWAAGIYNILFGIWAIFFPLHFFRINNLPIPNYPVIWQGTGMIVGLYGIVYILSGYDLKRYWPMLLIGLTGKILGPLGFVFYLLQNKIPFQFVYIHITNDFIWILPFILILSNIKKNQKG